LRSGLDSAYDIHVFDAGRVVRHVRRAFRPTPVNQAHVDAWLDLLEREAPSGGPQSAGRPILQ
jgi:hypothetical protein